MIKHKCFICLKNINSNYSPKICHCKGSLKSHPKCLTNYIIKYKKDECDICKYKYNIDQFKLYLLIFEKLFFYILKEIIRILKLSFGLFLLFNVYYALFYLNYFILSFFFNEDENLFFYINILIIFEIIHKRIINKIIRIKKKILKKNIIYCFKEI